jgi:hypothetical protein
VIIVIALIVAAVAGRRARLHAETLPAIELSRAAEPGR